MSLDLDANSEQPTMVITSRSQADLVIYIFLNSYNKASGKWKDSFNILYNYSINYQSLLWHGAPPKTSEIQRQKQSLALKPPDVASCLVDLPVVNLHICQFNPDESLPDPG